MEKNILLRLIILLIFSDFISSTELLNEIDIVADPCLKSDLYDDHTEVSIIEEKDSKIGDNLLKHGTTCIVTCKSNKLQTYKVCQRGKWRGDDVCDTKVRKLSRQKRWFWLIVPAIGCWFVRCRRTPPPPARDRTKPNLLCPGDITKPADPLQIVTKVTWAEPQARDDKDGNVKTTRTGPKPGSMFSEGRNNVIKYHARDNSGNMATCSFIITITVARCPNLNRVNNGYYICHPSNDMRNGGSCRFGCYEGHTLQGVSRSWCQGSTGFVGRWSGWSLVQPYCKKNTCNQLYPISSQQIITCTDGNNFRSICRFTCVNGYDIPPGSARVMVCEADQTWRGNQPICVDVAPPVFNKSTCPHSLTFYTNRGTNTGQVYWSEPTVTDNSGVLTRPIKQSGPSSMSVLQHGVYTVVYGAEDKTGNTAKPCIMKIIVKYIRCWTVYPTPYSSVSCPAGTGYGENCQFDCSGGTTLNGSHTVTCEKTGNPPYGQWSWGSYQPFCQFQQTCHDLTPPVRGALACDVWYGGRYCHPLCQDGYDVRPGRAFPNLVVCGDSGSWTPSTNFADCIAARGSRKTMVKLYFYYTGVCSDTSVQTEIKKKFIEAMLNTGFSLYCLNEPKCTFHNVEVKCGKTRRKRDTSQKMKRSTDQIEITLTIERSNSADLNIDQFNTENNEFYKFLEDTKDDISAGKYDIEVSSGKLKPSNLEADELELRCDNRSVPSYPSLKCVNCTAGTYYTTSETNKPTCEPCGRGYYQPSEGQVTCLKCPTGKSTEDEMSKSSTQCIDACKPGTWSSTSLPPCSKCPVGTYQKDYGGTDCTSCPAGTTTPDEGSSSINSCQEFDIVFEEDETGNAPPAISMRNNGSQHMGEYNIVFRAVCYGTCQGDIISIVDDSGNTQANITNDQNTTIIIKGSRKQSSFSPIEEQWYGLVLRVTNTESQLYVDGSLIATVSTTSDGIGPTSSIQIGGNGFTGSISNLNIFTKSFDITQMKQFSSKCSNSDKGNWLSWGQLQSIDLKKAYIQFPSQCDDVNECLSYPCAHGQCIDKLDAYNCTCDPGFTNTRCDVNIDDCVINMCQNNATCEDGVESYTCNCKHGFTGELCEVAVVDGGWTVWGNWTECSTTCGTGTRMRKRACSNPSPDNGGIECTGDDKETENCTLEICPSCDTKILNSKVENGIFNCTKNETADLYVCEIECNEDYLFDHVPADNYTCGNSTFYLWDFITDDNPDGILPECIPMATPAKVFVTHSATYDNLSCTSSNTDKAKKSVLSTITSAVDELPCIKDKTCTKGTIQVSNCNGNRRKRDTSTVIDTAGFNLQLFCDSNTYGTDQCYSLLITAIREILGMESAGQLTTEVEAVDYIIQANSSSSNDEVVCPENTVKFYLYCVPCGKGRYYKGGNCEHCPVGTYQDQLQQSICKNCSKSTTTNGTGSSSIDDCNVSVEVYTSDIDTTDNTELKTKLIIGIVMGTVVVIAIAVVIIYRCIRKHYRYKSRKTSQGSGFTLSMVQPYSWGPAKKVFDPRRMQQYHTDDMKVENL